MPDEQNQPGSLVTSDEDIQQYIRQELEKVRQEEAKKGGQPYTPPTPEPIKLKLYDKEFSFKDHEELNSALQTAFDQQRTREQELRQELETAKKTPAPPITKEDKEAWEFNKYVEKMGKDPREAQAYLDNDRFGFDPVSKLKELEDKVKSLSSETENSRRERIANGFRDAHPEFPGSPEAAGVIDGVMQNMGFEFDAKGLEAAWAIAQTRGFLKPVELNGGGNNPNLQQNNFGRQTPTAPRVGRSSANTESDLYAQAENMTADQLEVMLRSLTQR